MRAIIITALAAALAAAQFGCDNGGGGGGESDVGDTDSDSDSEDDGGPGDGGAEDDRGDPADFPSDCIEACQNACDEIEACGAAENESYPLDAEECLERCLLGQDGYMWDDVSGNFRCCASQESCQDVQVCGGWLAHPDTIDPCSTLCQCMFGGSVLEQIWSDVEPPDGYRFPASVIAVENSSQTVDYQARYGVEAISLGRAAFLRFEQQLAPLASRALLGNETVLPTFVDGAGRVAAATGEIVARVADDEALERFERGLADLDLGAPERIRFSDDLFSADAEDGWRAARALPELNAISGVEAELDMLRVYERRWEPSDPLFPEQWHLLNDGQEQLASWGIDSRVSEAWDLTSGDSETLIAILDDGMDINHADLAANCAEPYNFPDDWESMVESMMFGWHGTSCAGVAAAIAGNGEGGAGVCPDCRLLPSLLAGEGGPTPGPGFQLTDQEIADIFVDIVDLGADVISNSWGPAGEDPNVDSTGFPAPALPTIVSEAFDYAESDGRGGLGTVILFAAGNSNQNADGDTYVVHDYVIGVGALDDQGLKSYYSNYGNTIDLAAPSNGGLLGITTTSAGADSDVDPQYTDSFGGTSSATPLAAGVAGLMLSAAPDLTAAEVRQIITDSADETDPVFGRWTSGFSPFYGHGRVNAYRAVSMALGSCAPSDECPAPSDVCDGACDGAACDTCRTEADCADGFVCQPLPALGDSFCVESGAGSCADGFELLDGYCLPSREACGMCDGEEICNGRDDDCDGQVDEDLDCDGSPRCLQRGRGCPAEMGCAATSCMDSCEYDDDCEDGTCEMAKDRWGDLQIDVTVCSGGTLGCQMGCEVLASSLPGDELWEFVECADGASCAEIFECAMMLPINM
jgi:hypothetical protein